MFHRHSTFFGFLATAISVLAVGQLTHWFALWMVLTGIAGVCILPRFFYGFDEARALDKEKRLPGSGGWNWKLIMSPKPTQYERDFKFMEGGYRLQDLPDNVPGVTERADTASRKKAE